MTFQDRAPRAGRGSLARRSRPGSDRSCLIRSARAGVSCLVIASALFVGLGAMAQSRGLSRSEVEAISRSEARREIQRRETMGQNVPTDLMQVGPQGRPTTVNGNGTTVTRNR